MHAPRQCHVRAAVYSQKRPGDRTAQLAVEGVGENSFAHRHFSYVTNTFIAPPEQKKVKIRK
jgi:hypothetical protein